MLRFELASCVPDSVDVSIRFVRQDLKGEIGWKLT